MKIEVNLAPPASAASRGQPVAGRELDAEVAEKVMGYWDVGEYEGRLVHGERNMNGWPVDTPHYSTDLTAALSALAEVGGIVTITRMKPDEWHVRLHGEQHAWWAETLPLAICIALLAAVAVPEVTR